MSITVPRPLEYPELYRPGMGTENVAPFLRSLVQMLRPNRLLEVGAGYTTPFLLEALINNEHILHDGNLKRGYELGEDYDPRLVIIDDMSLGDLRKRDGMDAIIDSEYVEFVEGVFQGKAEELSKRHGMFDFVWFDCGRADDYKTFIEEYWEICSHYIIFHYTYSDGLPNEIFNAITSNIKGNPFTIDIIEPHKAKQGSVTICKKRLP